MASRQAITGPLVRSAAEPRYFHDPSGRPVLLVGSHTWNNLIDMGPRGRVVPFDWDAYLRFLSEHNHNFIRLWAYDAIGTWNPVDEVLHFPWQRTGPGVATDGRLRFDLTQHDGAYFERLRDRVAAAEREGVYVGVMLFDSWSNFLQTETPMETHIFAGPNNVNGIDILPTASYGIHAAWCTLSDPRTLDIQESYVRRVVQTVNEFDNVLFEISNEAGAMSHPWQEHLTRYIRWVEADLPKRHPIGQTGGASTSNAALHASSADYVAPAPMSIDRRADGYRTGHYAFGEGPGDRGDRPVVLDTDHLWGVGGDELWAWKSFCRGYNVIYMDPWDDQPAGFFVHPRWPLGANHALRREMGAILELAERIGLSGSIVSRDAASSGYCITRPDRAYVAFNPAGAAVTVELSPGRWLVRWRDVAKGTWSVPHEQLVSDAGTSEFVPDIDGANVLHLEAVIPPNGIDRVQTPLSQSGGPVDQ